MTIYIDILRATDPSDFFHEYSNAMGPSTWSQIPHRLCIWLFLGTERPYMGPLTMGTPMAKGPSDWVHEYTQGRGPQ